MKEKYINQVFKEMKKEMGYSNFLAMPRIEKVVINSGVGKFSREKEKVDELIMALAEITGQRPVKTKAHSAISGFKIRKGMEIGLKVTLRGKRMWHFLDRLINVGLPRMRDFQGIEDKSIDAKGNLNIGIKEHLIFPEIAADKAKNIFGLQVTVVTKAKNREEAIRLYKILGFPLK